MSEKNTKNMANFAKSVIPEQNGTFGTMHQLIESREELIEKLIAHVKKHLPADQADLIAKFAWQYYATVALEDLLSHDLLDLYGALLSQWSLMQQRKPGETRLRIYNPQYEQNGWQSQHTVIELSQDDMPFLVDSMQMELNRRELTTHMLVHVGGLKVLRDPENHIIDILPLDSAVKNCVVEAAIFIEIDLQTDPHVLQEIHTSLDNVLRDVHATVNDWRGMLAKFAESLDGLISNPPPIDASELAETIAFLKWLQDNHFTFMGCRDYKFKEEGDSGVLYVVPESGLGVLREHINNPTQARNLMTMPEHARAIAVSKKNVLILAKTNTKSTVHRPAYPDVIVIKVFNEKGELIGGRHFIGLYTSAAYNRSPSDIPFLRQKVAYVMKKSALSTTGHAGKALLNILETFPRDDLFQAQNDELFELVMGILHLQERRRIRLFVRKDIYGRFMSCLVYVPRDRYDTDLRVVMEEVLVNALHGTESSFSTTFSESVLARIHYMIRVDPSVPVDYDVNLIEAKLIEVARSWQDNLLDYIKDTFGEERGNTIVGRYLNLRGFPAGYREENTPRTAVYDINHIEALQDDTSLEMSLFQPIDSPANSIRFKLYSLNHPTPLSDVLPILENMGLRVLGEDAYKINLQSGSSAWITDFGMKHDTGDFLDVDVVKNIFQEAFAKVWYGDVENDGFNRLVLLANLTWREIVVLRAYAKYFRQINFNFSQTYIEQTLTKHPNITAHLVKFFILRFDPDLQDKREETLDQISKEIKTALDAVESSDEDKILQQFFLTMKATVRTNYFQKNEEGECRSYLSFKLASDQIPDMPLPKPLFEIFVYSPAVEGIHLRSAKVARGGLRWSDRREDYRTEVLGLMKAQKVKNSVIVPSGAKGGFIPKLLPVTPDRKLIMLEVVKNYKMFIRGLLDLTDNLKEGKVIKPAMVVCHDEDDPYLVVAADKGTATFSNYANEVAAEYDFWLGDAFASGGGTGYDHKKMGITARGAWESVKRHFRELNVNILENDFTVVGIGDLAGDVFGNGMLLSNRIKLVGAFNHLHIFIDPCPDPLTSFAERERIFNLPSSSWEDYDRAVMSPGSGIYNRSAKFITLSPQAMERFGLTESQITPNNLIKAILKAKVDLLWNGGIGTFVKASHEHHSEVGDKNTDAIRVNGNELNCRVVGEGGNLGCTQLGRVEYALHGGMIYTDFIDNSAGVDCSDHEVNIKILLNAVVASGDMTLKQRNKLLVEMTDEVGALVLRDNYMQTQAISIAAAQANNNMDFYIRFIQELDESGKLDRKIEFLPDEKELFERKSLGKGLTRPEIAILISYSKMFLKADILESDIPEDPYISSVMKTAFPARLSKMFPQQMCNHSLRREIIATQLSNAIINDMGVTFIKRVNEETGAPIAAIVRCYLIAQEAFEMREMWSAIEALDYQIESKVQIDMMLSAGRLIRRSTRWFLHKYRSEQDIQAIIKRYSPGIALLYKNLPRLLLGNARDYLDVLFHTYSDAGVPEALAQQVANSTAMFSALDIVAVTNDYGFSAKDVAKTYFALGARLSLAWFRWQMIQQPAETHWEILLKSSFRDDIDFQQRELTIGVLQFAFAETKSTEEAIELWCIEHKSMFERWEKIQAELRGAATKTYIMFAVLVRCLVDLSLASKETIRQKSKDKK